MLFDSAIQKYVLSRGIIFFEIYNISKNIEWHNKIL